VISGPSDHCHACLLYLKKKKKLNAMMSMKESKLSLAYIKNLLVSSHRKLDQNWLAQKKGNFNIHVAEKSRNSPSFGTKLD
jgi:hypothetical protein